MNANLAFSIKIFFVSFASSCIYYILWFTLHEMNWWPESSKLIGFVFSVFSEPWSDIIQQTVDFNDFSNVNIKFLKVLIVSVFFAINMSLIFMTLCIIRNFIRR